MSKIRKSGILLHPTSLPSDYCLGDFGEEAYRFMDTLAKTNQTLWQILPLSPVDDFGSPYQSLSAFAGETLLISLKELVNDGYLTHLDLPAPISNSHIDISKARSIKAPLFKLAFENFQTQNKSDDYISFCKENNFWLEDYTLFSALKKYFLQHPSNNPSNQHQHLAYTKNTFWELFPPALRKHIPSEMRIWKSRLAKEIEEQAFLQFIFHKQWKKIKNYANQHNIKIIGDIPIFISFDSADVWANQSLFLLDENMLPTGVAGVPPDYFSEKGQLWGNPLYRWEAHKSNNYLWWTARLRHALAYADMLRIDHFRGFASYWEIPFGATNATAGTWRKSVGKDFFLSLKKEFPDLPFIAEDLGCLSADVHKLRQRTGLPGMRILQFAFDGDKNNDYLPYMYNENTVVYTGTHDNNTTLGWYNEASEEERDFFRRYMNTDGQNPAWDAIRLAFSSAASMAIIPLQDVLALDGTHRMNTPGIAQGNWSFSFHWDMWLDWQKDGLIYLSDLFGRNQKKKEDAAKE